MDATCVVRGESKLHTARAASQGPILRNKVARRVPPFRQLTKFSAMRTRGVPRSSEPSLGTTESRSSIAADEVRVGSPPVDAWKGAGPVGLPDLTSAKALPEVTGGLKGGGATGRREVFELSDDGTVGEVGIFDDPEEPLNSGCWLS